MADNYDAYWADIGVDPTVLDNAPEVPSVLLKPVPELPLVSNSDFDIVAVIGNKDSVRISWVGLTQNFVSCTTDIPLEPGYTSGIAYATIAVDETAIYSNDGGAWGKTPRYTAHWEDITENTRFLLVNSVMELTPTEIANARESLDLGIANESKLGLVKPSSSVLVDQETGEMIVPQAVPKTSTVSGSVGTVRVNDEFGSTAAGDTNTYVVTETYVKGALDNFASTYVPAIASYDTKGVVQIALPSNSALRVDDNGVLSLPFASNTTYGAVKLVGVTDYDPDVDYGSAPTAELVNSLIEASENRAVNTIASTTTLGMIKIPADGSITIDATTGTIALRQATLSDMGVVAGMVDEISVPTDVTKAVTQKAVVDYVDLKMQDSLKNLPVASTTVLGAVRVGEGLKMSEDDPEVLNIVSASESYIGGVKVEPAQSSLDDRRTTVPTVARVQELLGSAGVGVATYTNVGVVKLGTPGRVSDGVPVGINSSDRLVIDKSQIRNAVASIIPGAAVATVANLGVVRLSSGAPVSGLNIPIRGESDGAIWVSPDDVPKANAVQSGFVTLSTSVQLDSSKHAAIGVDEYGHIRVAGGAGGTGGGGSSYSVVGSTDIGYDSALVGTRSGTAHLAIGAATVNEFGTVRLGTGDTIEGGLPVGVNADGSLYAAYTGGGGGGEPYQLPEATTNILGGVKLGSDEDLRFKASIPVAMNKATKQLGIAADSIAVSPATDSEYGTVVLGTNTIFDSDYALVGRMEDPMSGVTAMAVHKATSTAYGVVKVSGPVISGDDSIIVGTNPDGSLAIQADQVSSPFKVKVRQEAGSYIISMQGGVIQMQDGTFVNVASVDNVNIGTPDVGQSLVLNVTIDEEGIAHARFSLTDTINVVNCTPEVDLI